jgi:3-oxoadipate enol-lactonase
MGTIVCQHVAAQEPKRVKSLALFGPLIAPTDTARQGIAARAAKLHAEGLAGMHEVALALVQGALSADTRQRLPLAVAFVRESLMRQEPAAYARSCEALTAAQPAAVDGIACPLLLVTGEEDAVAPPQAVRAMADRFHASANKRVAVLPRTGHWTPIERPEECQRELREFLSGLRS